MAEKRMFSKKITRTDAFLGMPMSSRCLYYELNQEADDEGFVNNPITVMRMIGASQDDFNVLVTKKFILPFDSGIVVIKHWLIHNTIRKDRLKPTNYLEEKAMLHTKENGAYTLNKPQEIQCPSSDGQVTVKRQHRLDKISLDKNRLDKSSIGEPNVVEEVKPKKPHKETYLEFVKLTKEEYKKLTEELGENRTKEMIERLNNYIGSKGKKYKSHYHTILAWDRKDKKDAPKKPDWYNEYKEERKDKDKKVEKEDEELYKDKDLDEVANMFNNL